MASKRLLRARQAGFSYVEALAALVLTAILLTVLTRVVGNVLEARETTSATHDVVEETRFALERMVRAVSGSQRLLVPQAENLATSNVESIRDPGVLAVTLDSMRDLDGDGFPDADNDRDGRIDEDVGSDAHNDFSGGVYQIDDDNNGAVDPPFTEWSDDESGGFNEDALDGSDNDGDGAVDEDPSDDMNGDNAPGIVGFDDDGDGNTDEGNKSDDDEDGTSDEDWWDTVAFYQVGTDLMERVPVPWDETGAGGITGRDFVVRTLADNVAQFRVERIPAPNGGPPLVNITLARTDALGNPLSLAVTIGLGGGS